MLSITIFVSIFDIQIITLVTEKRKKKKAFDNELTSKSDFKTLRLQGNLHIKMKEYITETNTNPSSIL